ncbi:unnamed protein product [Adineta steineri]|uniref:Uncharacterized protein n=1 Tax=Adineta steineri TaxID=433720 RepID=A0A818K7N5_9BILA|nr:unnamed protein product [Adineta steineri]CAF0733070.1 unnamed protein product [Adineta steineri]CAF3551039.1 unnamed protein product [Adineta steineri]CAF3803274.1 unnamed protein product [Adineta steineri]
MASNQQHQSSAFRSSDIDLGFEKSSLLFFIGGGCLLIVLVAGIILCRLDISAGDRRRQNPIRSLDT